MAFHLYANYEAITVKNRSIIESFFGSRSRFALHAYFDQAIRGKVGDLAKSKGKVELFFLVARCLESNLCHKSYRKRLQ